MITRIEKFNNHLLEQLALDPCPSEVCDEGEIPIMKIDDRLEFIIDYLWNNFIGDVLNKDKMVIIRIEENRRIIQTVIETRMANDPDELSEKMEFERRGREVDFYYPELRGEERRKRIVAHHIATLTDDQVREIAGVL